MRFGLLRIWAASFLGLLLTPLVATGQQNNVILFSVDDLGWADNNLAYNETLANLRGDADAFFETPNLKTLSQNGMTFTKAYSSSPVCSPTRASMMLGQSPTTHKISQWIGAADEPGSGFSYVRDLPLAATTLAESFRSAGYQTAHAGKWHLGDDETPLAHGFDENYGGGRQGTPGSWFANNSGGFGWANNLPNDGSTYAGEYLTDRLTRDAVDFINTASDNSQPFFLNMSHYGVHIPINAPSNLIPKYASKLNSGDYEKFNSLSSSQKTSLATYAAMVESIDLSLGAIQQSLIDKGVADNTTIAFISDNGGLSAPEAGSFGPSTLNSPLRNGKGNLYEGGIRVPMIIGGPGVTAGVNDSAVVAHDLFPTLLNAAGIALPNQSLDGVALNGILSGQSSLDRGDSPVVIHYPHHSNQGGTPGGAIIVGETKLIQSYQHGGIELFDLQSDLSETTDIERVRLDDTEDLRVEMHRFLERTSANVPTAFTIDTRHAGRSIAVANGDFEMDTVIDNDAGSPNSSSLRSITDWQWVDGVQVSFGGLSNPDAGTGQGPDFSGTDGSGLNGAMDGEQVVYFGSFEDTANHDVTGQLIGIEQTLEETLIAGGEYTIRFAAAARSDQTSFVDGLVRLVAGSEVIGEYETPHDANGLFREYQFIVDTDGLDASLFGQPLKIQLFRDTDGGKVSYDNIRLYTTAVPEPNSFGLLLVGMLFGLGRRKRIEFSF